MSSPHPRVGVPAGAGRVAYAVVRGAEPRVFIAENSTVLDRVLGLELVAQTPARDLHNADVVDQVRSALMDERWADALLGWMTATDLVVDVYDDEPVWTDRDLDVEAATFEIRVAPIFSD